MQPSSRTEEMDGAPAPAADAPTAEHVVGRERLTGASEVDAAGDGAGAVAETNAPVRPSLATAVREQCSACGAAMAPDQRYCVECGQRRGPARVPVLDEVAQRSRQPNPAPDRPRRARMSVNSTLIAGVGVLLLAIGVGVLIGRSANSSSSKAPAAQVVKIEGGGGGGSGAASAAAPSTTTQPSTSSAASKAAKASAAAAAAASAKSIPKVPLKKVTIGTPGKGPGYQHGHFTGNFFGPEAEEK